MSCTERYIDTNGVEFKVGDRVNDGRGSGVVESVSDPDGDVDDEGRSITIPPRALVKFDDGEDDYFTSYWTAQGPWDDDAPWQFDDLEKES